MSKDSKRQFTRAEDELIMLNAQGGISVHSLTRRLRCGYPTLERRADELGVTLVTREEHFEPVNFLYDIGSNPYHVGLLDKKQRRDLLLVKLHEKHGDRQYEVAIINTRGNHETESWNGGLHRANRSDHDVNGYQERNEDEERHARTGGEGND